MELQGKRGEGAFQWNRGGWFGAQLGATLWLVLLGVLLLAKGEAVGAWVVVLGLVPNGVGLVVWRRRWDLSPYPAVQGLVAVCGLAALLAVLSIRNADCDLASLRMPESPWFLLIYPGMMAVFHFQERTMRRAAG